LAEEGEGKEMAIKENRTMEEGRRRVMWINLKLLNFTNLRALN
jgi:hypothetical protein